MIFKHNIGLACIVASFATLYGCPGQDENKGESGLIVHFAEAHLEQQLITSASTILTASAQSDLTVSANAVTTLAATGGYDRENLQHHDIIDNNNHLLSIYHAFLVLDEVELVACTSLSQLPLFLLNTLIPTASAHAGHGSEPVGGRGLDKPNVIDIVTQDEYILPLGDLSVSPGSYCGIRVSFTRAANAVYGKPDVIPASDDDPTTLPEVPDMTGKMFVLRADFCSTPDGIGGCAGRSKVDIDDTALELPSAQTLSFAQPLEVNETVRSAYVTVGIAYGQWVQDIDVSLLTSDLNERQKLLNNIANSVHIYANGLGDLPVNAP